MKCGNNSEISFKNTCTVTLFSEWECMTEVLISSLLIYYLSFDVGLLASLKFHAFIYGYFKPSYIYTLNKFINATLLFLPPFFMSWTQRSKTFSMYIKGLFLSNIVHKSVEICVSEHFSFAEIIHPPHRCGISICRLDSMIIAQVLGWPQ